MPKVVEGYTAERVLTTERVRGVKIDEIRPLTRLDHDLSLLADELGKATSSRSRSTATFTPIRIPATSSSCCPRQGNPRTPSDIAATTAARGARDGTPLAKLEQVAQREAAPAAPAEEPRLALIDFGMTARLSPPMRDRIVRLLFDLAENRGDDAGETLIEIGEPIADFDRTGFIREIGR